MPFYTCKRCGGNIAADERATIATCNTCHSEQALPGLRDPRITRRYERAEFFRRRNEFDKAATIYEELIDDESPDAEVYWSLALCCFGIEYVVDPATGRHVPTMHRAQPNSIFDDTNYALALRHATAEQKRVYEANAREINEIHRGVLEISGREEPFDIFICYKETDDAGERTEDSLLAEQMYDELTDAGYKVFFARITLEDKLGSAYEPYIFAALNSAKVMIVVGTKAAHFQAVWVKNEWDRFLDLVEKSHGQKMLIPAYRDISPYEMPEEFQHLQGQDLSKVGAIKEIVRQIKKNVPIEFPAASAPTPAPAPAPAPAPTPEATLASEVAPLLRRAFMFLEDEEYTKADECCEQVLNRQPENGEAYLVKLMIDLKIKTRAELKASEQPLENSRYFAKILRYADPNLRREMTECNTFIKERNAEAARQRAYNEAAAAMEKSTSKNEYIKAAGKFEQLGDYRDARARARRCRELAAEAERRAADAAARAEEAIRRGLYDREVAAMNAAQSEQEFLHCAENFRNMGSYLDAAALAEQCTARAEEARQAAAYAAAEENYAMACMHNRQEHYDEAARLFAIASSQFSALQGWKDAALRARTCNEKLSEARDNQQRVRQDAAIARAREMQNLVREGKRKKRKKIFVLVAILAVVAASILWVFATISNAKKEALEDMKDKYGDGAVVTVVWDYLDVNNGEVFHELLTSDCPKNLTIPNAVVFVFRDGLTSTYEITSIAERAFNARDEIKTVTIANGVTRIGSYAFERCTKLTSVTIPASVTSIGSSAFKECKSLTGVTIPNGITSISYGAFEKCTSLTAVTIPASVTEIDDFAFSGCTNLSGITYGGTMEQWRAVKKGMFCFDDVGNYTVHCTDGDIT